MDWSTNALGVVGGGTMGAGIAICGIRAGIPTVVHELDAERAEAARGRVAAFLAKSVERGKLSAAERDAALDRLDVTTDLGGFARCGAVVEAIYEDLGAKRELFGALDDVCDPATVFATNTSTLSVTQIAAGSRIPERVVGLHFCNPAPLMPLVESVRGLRTGEGPYDVALSLVEALGKQAVRVDDTPGFFVNRFLVPFENDCIRALEGGAASVEDIDRAVTLGLGHPMGPFTLLDTVGLDIHRAVSLSLFEQLRDPRFAPPPLVDRMIAAGYLGRKTGQGFYTYEQAGMFGA
jgi:3-hydroxybutyryl-CoA dehydrogenase